MNTYCVELRTAFLVEASSREEAEIEAQAQLRADLAFTEFHADVWGTEECDEISAKGS